VQGGSRRILTDSGEGSGPSPAASLKTYGILLLKVLMNLSDPAAGHPQITIVTYYLSQKVVEKPWLITNQSIVTVPRPPTGMVNLIRDETEEEPSGSSALVAQEGGFIPRIKDFQ
jgi:hypothetical protein